MTLLAVIAQHTQETDAGLGTGLLIGAIVLIVLGVTLGFWFMHRRARASRGGVEPAPGAQSRRGEPPFEGISREP